MIMLDRATKLSLIILAVFFITILPVTAAINTISQGDTIFIGEEGLNVQNAVESGTTIAWWASGASIATSSPDSSFIVSDATNFYASPQQFGAYTGSWYALPEKTPVFTIASPNLNLRIEDTTVGVDVTGNKWVYRGDVIGFRIETNLISIVQRTGSPSVPITIKVQTPDGGVYSTLVNNGVSTVIDPYPVTVSPQNTGGIWDTGNSAYSAGTYTIWAECNANRMKDNYEASGKTVTPHMSLKNQEQNPLISASVPTTSPTTSLTTVQKTVTTRLPTTTLTTAPATTTPVIPVTELTTSETVVTTLPAAVVTTPTQTSGFGIIIAIVSLFVIAALVLKKQ